MPQESNDWLNEFNAAAFLAQDGKFQDALTILNELAPRLREEPTLAPKFHVMFESRRAALNDLIGQRNEALKRYSAAMRIAYGQMHDESEVCSVYRQLMETICKWEDWKFLLETAEQLMLVAENRGFRIAVLEAAYHMPYAYRGIGDRQRAREHATAILERMRETKCNEEIARWTEFIRGLDATESGDSGGGANKAMS